MNISLSGDAMYRVDKTRSRKKLFIQFVIAFVLFFAAITFAIWFFILRTNSTESSNFSRAGGTYAAVEAKYSEFTTAEFKIKLPDGWIELGKKNPTGDQSYYEYQSQVKDYENRWLKVYVDIFPSDYSLNQLLPIEPNGNKLTVGTMSGDCRNFDGAPSQGSTAAKSQSWTATWQDIQFNCNIQNGQNHTGTASKEQGYGVSVTGATSGTHKYFFVYIDHNIRPQLSILTDSVKSFEAI